MPVEFGVFCEGVERQIGVAAGRPNAIGMARAIVEDAMPTAASLIAFALVSLGLVLTPGPNMIYLVSRTLAQGRKAGLISLAGVALGFVVYMLCAAFGITALVLAVPYAYDSLRIGGAIYLLYLAWRILRSGGDSSFQLRALAPAGPGRLFAMGLVNNLLNPKVAVMYLSLLPQFMNPDGASPLTQALALGATQIVVSVSVNAVITLSAGSIAGFFHRRPAWAAVQRWIMATALGVFALRIATDSRR
jgi:threonine/homoserine/homoserine lactone efflux protein